MTGLAGQRVFVTAGATGIGATLVRRFTEAGARVAFCDVDADAVAAQTIGTGHVADVTDEAAMAEVFKKVEAELGGIDVVCANAGIGGPAGKIEDISLEDWQATLYLEIAYYSMNLMFN